MHLSKARVVGLINAIVCSVSVVLLLGGHVIAERLPIRTYTTADGLPRDRINRIVQDSKGFLWFCTSEGLSRFDGYKFTNYGIEEGLAGREVNDFLETRAGVYWVATNGGLCRFIPDALPGRASLVQEAAPRRFVVYYPGETPQSRTINAIHEDRTGRVWCCTEQGLYRVDQSGGEPSLSLVDIILPGDKNTGVPLRTGAVIEDRRGSLWIAALSGLHRLRPDGTVERYTAEEGWPGGCYALLEDKNGRIWAGSSLGLCLFVPDPKPHRSIIARRYTVKDGLAGDVISCLCESSNGTLWTGTWTGLSRFVPGANEEEGRFRSYTQANGISGVIALYEDSDNNLWIGTDSRGAMRLAATGFVTYNEADGLGGTHSGTTRASSIFENQAHELCVVSASSPNVVISKFDRGRFIAVPLTLPPGISYWGWGWNQVIFQDHSGEWWMSTGQGLVRYPKLTNLAEITHAHPKAVYRTRDGLSADEIFRVYEDSRGDIWISTLGNANNVMSRWDRATGTIHRYPLSDVVGDSAPTAFCDDSAGNLWIGFYNGGIERYRDGRFTKFTVADGVPAGFVEGFYADHGGRLWVATGEGGVARVDHPGDERPTFSIYSTTDGLSSNQANSITEDRWGMIYIGTGRGVDKLDPATGHIRHYTAADGLAGNLVIVSFRDHNGSLWFGTLQGLSRLDSQPERTTSAPPVFITAMTVAGVSYPISELGVASLAGPRLAASQNNVQIEFAGLSFAAGESLRYQYKLEGASSDWSTPSDQRAIAYPNLVPGSYRFLVRAVRSDGTLSQMAAAASFTILPPVWQQWWFRIIAIILVALPVAALLRYRHQKTRAVREAEAALQKSREERLRELERVRTRIATDLHDDIGSSLTQIAILGEVAHRNVGAGDGRRGMEPLERIISVSNELVDTMSDIVWAINPNRDHLSDLVHRMRRFASDVFTSRGIWLKFDAPSEDGDIELGANLRREVFLIFKETVNNIVKHSGCSSAAVKLLMDGGWLTLEVSDDGKGFDCSGNSDGPGTPAAAPRGGNGIPSMRKRAQEMGGRFDIVSAAGRGTATSLRVFVQKTAGQ
ncbi:MAG TPA: two-component regulator propeller domain-containing protein [Blastocatellia bacterium]|nr:two-component regulator propeller domain-containing protein [Blastocatellia bacterium]